MNQPAHTMAKLQAAGGLRTLTFDSASPLQLSSGQMLAPLTIAFETYGALNADKSNAVLVCHHLAGDQFVAGPNPVTGRPAWWPRIVGPGRPLDTNRFYVICANVLGGAMGTTGPASPGPDGKPYGLRFPFITVADMVRAQSMLVEALGIQSLFLVIGGGAGGMQALQWASAYPKRVFACATIAAAARRSAQNTAFHEIGRHAIMADPDWRGGAYAREGVRPQKGLAVARLAAHIADSAEPALLRQLAGAQFSFGGDTRLEATSHQPGQSFIDRFDANCFLYLTRAMDSFDLAADFGGQLANAFKGGQTRHCVFGFSSDWRYPREDNRALVRALIASGAEAAYVEIETDKGHGAYLGEEPEFEAALTGFVDAAAAARDLALQGGG